MPLTAPQSPSIDPERLLSPAVGAWWPLLMEGAMVQPGMLLGHIDRLGRRLAVHAGRATGQASGLRPAGPVQYGAVLLELGALAEGLVGASAPSGAKSTEGLVAITAPMSGTVYLAPAPGEPPFAAAGARVERMGRIALLEVMKTFTPIASTQAGTLERFACVDGDAVSAGDPVAYIRPD